MILAGELLINHDPHIKETDIIEDLPYTPFLQADTTWAIVNVMEDIDSKIRFYPLGISSKGKYYMSLAIKATTMIRGETLVPERIHITPSIMEVNLHNISTIDPMRMWINFAGPPARTFPTFALAQVLDDATFDLAPGMDSDWMELFISPPPPGLDSSLAKIAKENPFKDKIVIIGNTEFANHDYKSTPFDNYDINNPKMAGVEVHANAIWTLLSEKYLKEVSFWIQLFVWLLLIGLVWWVVEHRHILFGGIVTAVVVVLIFVGSAAAFIYGNYLTQSIAPMTSVSMVFILTVLRRILQEQREKAKIRGMFGQYVPKKVVGELINNPDMLRLGGEKRRMSVLFTDVAGFTTISENLTPEELVHLLNEYLTAMTREILAQEGIIDKYEGDLIMAEFGAPIFYPDHAVRCCRAAVRMQRKLSEMRDKWASEGRPILYSRVGINTGDMIVGNMGSEEVFDYTVMGDAVNFSSRLESVNKIYGTTILCGAETYKDLNNEFYTRFIDRVRVVGKKNVVEIYEVIDEVDRPLSEQKREVLHLFRQGRELYDALEFQQAFALFKQAMAIDRNDGPSATFLRRSLEYMQSPPDDWDKAYTLTEK